MAGKRQKRSLLILTNTCYTLYSSGTQLGMRMGTTVLMYYKNEPGTAQSCWAGALLGRGPVVTVKIGPIHRSTPWKCAPKLRVTHCKNQVSIPPSSRPLNLKLLQSLSQYSKHCARGNRIHIVVAPPPDNRFKYKDIKPLTFSTKDIFSNFVNSSSFSRFLEEFCRASKVSCKPSFLDCST